MGEDDFYWSWKIPLVEGELPEARATRIVNSIIAMHNQRNRREVVPMQRDVAAEAQRLVQEALRAGEVERQKTELLRQIASYGDDTYDNGQVMRFSKQLATGGHAYTFAAVKAAGGWYITGRNGEHRFTWSDLVQWLVFGVPATNWTPMEPAATPPTTQDSTTE
jgi:hypothetical protein